MRASTRGRSCRPPPAHGLATVAGTSPDVGVVGYTIGGGIGLLSRRYGLAANKVHAIELVTADGALVRADREREPDLFWALRGGGGSFGVVTAIELELFGLAEAYAGALWFPVERAGEVMHAWRELTQAALPDELSTLARLLRFPPIPEVPEEVRGASFVIVDAYHAGTPAQADELLAPLRALGPVNDTIRVVTMPELSRVHMDPEEPVPGVGDGVMLAELPAEALDALIDVADEQQQLAAIEERRHLEGGLGRARPGHGALASIPAKYVLVGGRIGTGPGAGGGRERAGRGGSAGARAVDGPVPVPQLLGRQPRPGELLGGGRLPAAAPGQVRGRPRRPDSLEPSDPARHRARPMTQRPPPELEGVVGRGGEIDANAQPAVAMREKRSSR